MKIPNIDLKELKKNKEENHRERIMFIEKHAKWVKNNSNKKWSSEQKEVID